MDLRTVREPELVSRILANVRPGVWCALPQQQAAPLDVALSVADCASIVFY